MREPLDVALTEFYKEMSRKHIAVPEFSRKYGNALTMFMLRDDLVSVVDAIDEGRDTPTAHLRRLLTSSQVGGEMFRPWLKRVQFHSVRVDVKEQLDTLEYHQFDDAAWEQYQLVIRHLVNKMHENGIDSFCDRVEEFSFFGESVGIVVNSPKQIAKFFLLARIKEISFNSGQVAPYPWQSLAFAVGDLPATPRYALPDHFLGDLKNVSKAVHRIFVPDSKILPEMRDAKTVGDMRRLISTHRDALCQLDATFELDATFVSEKLEPLCLQKVRDATLTCLPTDTRVMSITQAT